MASIWSCAPPRFPLLRRNPPSLRPSSPILHLPLLPISNRPAPVALRATGTEGERAGSQGAQDPGLLRRPLVSPESAGPPPPPSLSSSSLVSDDEEARDGRTDGERSRRSKEEEWVDWEDQILEDTVPLVGFVRMILHSGRYESGDRLNPEHEKTILERLLPYHPEFEKKVGCGIDFITTGFHPEFENSRCLFIVRKDGELVDFSYWKCIKGLIRKNYPLYADSFILRHFRRRRQIE